MIVAPPIQQTVLNVRERKVVWSTARIRTTLIEHMRVLVLSAKDPGASTSRIALGPGAMHNFIGQPEDGWEGHTSNESDQKNTTSKIISISSYPLF